MRQAVRGLLRASGLAATRPSLRRTLGVSLLAIAAFAVKKSGLGSPCSAKMTLNIQRDAMIIEFPENGDFDAYLKDRDGGGVIVDFYATWCNPCMEALPKVLAISESEHRLGKKTDLLKVNVDNHERLVDRFEVSMIPCLVLIKNGKEIRRISGRQINEESIRELYKLGEANSN